MVGAARRAEEGAAARAHQPADARLEAEAQDERQRDEEVKAADQQERVPVPHLGRQRGRQQLVVLPHPALDVGVGVVGLILGGALEAALEGLHSELRREGRGEFAASEAPRFDAPAASNNDALGRRLAKTC